MTRRGPRVWSMMVSTETRILLAAVLVGSMVSVARATDGAREILHERRRLYETTYAWSDQHQVLRVTMVGRDGREQVRVLEIYERRYGDGDRRTLLTFLAPDALKGTAMLSRLRTGGAGERWLYLPKLRRVRRIAAPISDESVLGTDLTNRELDLMQAMVKWTESDTRATLRGDALIGGTRTYVLELVPRAQEGEYERLVLWVGTDDLVMRQLELYGADTAVTKRIRQTEVAFVGTVPVASHVEVENPRSGTRSAFDVLTMEFDKGFPEDMFNLSFLEGTGR